MFYMGWEDVVEVKNCSDNWDMALEVIEGLELVSRKHGRIAHTELRRKFTCLTYISTE